MSDFFNVSSSPHVRDKDTTAGIMRDVIIALLPASAFGVYNFGIKALVLIITAMLTCVTCEALYEYFMHRKITVLDYSAALTGLLIALNVPANLPVGMLIIGCAFAIIIVKQLFGGLGQNFMNPALAARCFLLISFTGRMTNFVYNGVDGISEATPLAILKGGAEVQGLTTSLSDMFIGTIGGTIGETSVIALLIGAAYLLFRRVITLRIPGTYIASFAVFILIFAPGHQFDFMFLLKEICGGGLILGAFFMATDYVTSPVTPYGKIVYGVILGLLTGLFRMYGGSAEGVSYAIIISNMLVPLIEKYTTTRAFGIKKEKKEAISQ